MTECCSAYESLMLNMPFNDSKLVFNVFCSLPCSSVDIGKSNIIVKSPNAGNFPHRWLTDAASTHHAAARQKSTLYICTSLSLWSSVFGTGAVVQVGRDLYRRSMPFAPAKAAFTAPQLSLSMDARDPSATVLDTYAMARLVMPKREKELRKLSLFAPHLWPSVVVARMSRRW
ncbi:hypothetical protein IF1G_07388 [Cordyceps javanica]|uniref:Uncharacterized protein n=1 Tax=Cordyceps javanica TaxID=43265 RepID=A0A545UW24_9HYPO|nr:hypothetical protein IF1G_07388 [Cordyceps javanica]